MIKRQPTSVILGAGLSGLSAAYHLKSGYSLFEKESEPGGMARSVYKDGYTFDYDGHLLHFRSEYAFSLINKLVDGNLAPHKRSSWIYSKGSYTRYPFQANFYGLPKDVVKDCLLGIIRARTNLLNGKVDLSGNFENWIRKVFGKGIAEHFMLPYNRKFWTVESADLTCDWLDGFVPVPTLEDTVTGAISTNTKAYGYNSRFWYPVKGGISEVVEGFLRKVNNIHVNKKAVTIDQYRKEIVFEDGTIRRFKRMITTIPMPELLKLLVNLPVHVKKAFAALRYTSIFVVNLGIGKDDITDRHWVYYPEEDMVFYRTGFATNFSLDVAPPGKTSVYIEISYSDRCPLDKEKAVRDTIKALKGLGIISDESEIEICLPMDIKYGYAIYDINRKWAVQVIKDYLQHFGIYSIGRYGSWSYMSMEDVILEGRETAAKLLNRGTCAGCDPIPQGYGARAEFTRKL
ncbi:MAG: FAD-dependent oxidoreductase [Candidatus Omnitrophica bacterium]|nr:FAD-dependent oxidoreductase [Candidatus Omnitrophota bacterium]MBU1933309.1 FAD-dependent oxidoreductase [Candidatus Omnitrophota bacterium]